MYFEIFFIHLGHISELFVSTPRFAVALERQRKSNPKQHLVMCELQNKAPRPLYLLSQNRQIG